MMMQKGKLGICLPFYAILSLVLAFLGQTLLCGLLLGFVIVAEKDEWTIRQTMQGLFISLFMSLVNVIFNSIDLAISKIFYNNIFDSITRVGSVFTTIFSVIHGIISLLVLIFIIIGIVRTAKGKDAGFPLFSDLAKRACGLVVQKVYTQAAPAYQNSNPAQAAQQPQDQQNNPNQPQQ